MKTKYISLFILLLAVAFSACEKKAIYKNFETQYSFQVKVPANSLVSSSLFPLSFAEESNSEAQYEVNDTRKDLVEEVFLKTFLLEVVSPQNEDLSFLNSAEFYIKSARLAESLVAFKDPVPSNAGRDVLFDITNTNLAPFIKEDAFSITSKVVTDENRTSDVTLKGTLTFNVKAKILGLD